MRGNKQLLDFKLLFANEDNAISLAKANVSYLLDVLFNKKQLVVITFSAIRLYLNADLGLLVVIFVYFALF